MAVTQRQRLDYLITKHEKRGFKMLENNQTKLRLFYQEESFSAFLIYPQDTYKTAKTNEILSFLILHSLR